MVSTVTVQALGITVQALGIATLLFVWLVLYIHYRARTEWVVANLAIDNELDCIAALVKAFSLEENPKAKDALARATASAQKLRDVTNRSYSVTKWALALLVAFYLPVAGSITWEVARGNYWFLATLPVPFLGGFFIAWLAHRYFRPLSERFWALLARLTPDKEPQRMEQTTRAVDDYISHLPAIIRRGVKAGA